MDHNFSSPAKMGLTRKGNRVIVILEFPNEYEAMQAFDTWSLEDIVFTFQGPKSIKEIEEVADAD